MSPAEGRHAARVAAAFVLPVLVGLALAVVLLLAERGDARTSADSSIRETVADSVTLIRTAIRDQLTAAGAGTQRGDTIVPADDLTGAPLSPTVAITARDTGSARLDDSTRVPAIVAPVYRGGAAPASTAQRRAAITSFRVVPLALREVVSRLAPSTGGLLLRGPTRDVVAAPRPAMSGARSFGVDMDLTGMPGWDVVAWRPDPGIPAGAWFWAAALLVGFAGAGALLAALVRREAASAARVRSLEHERGVITGLAPVLQTSLDIGEVIPAVAVHLADRLNLTGLSLSTPERNGETPLFVWGTPPDVTVAPRVTRTAAVRAGETVAVTLSRGGRALGVLRIVAGEPMDAERVEILGTAGELLGSTIANADAHSRQLELLARMRSVDELKTVFLATASHELRTPVTAIVGFTTLLLEQWQTTPPERARDLVTRVMSNGRRLNALIEQLLDFSRVERGLPQASEELFNLGATVERILSDQPELHAKHELDLEIVQECLVRGSSAAVERIVTNLVGNAAKYSPAGSRITVTVRLHQGDEATAALIIDDEGPGVPEQDRERIFSRFYRGHGDAVTRTRGAGIGLAIVSEYAASMSGSATAGAAPGGGARFVVTFPSVAVVANDIVAKAVAHAASGDTAADDTTSGDTTSGDTTSGDTTSGDTTSLDVGEEQNESANGRRDVSLS